MHNKNNNIPLIEKERLQVGKAADFFHMLDEALDLGIAILDENMRYQYIGKGTYSQLGLSKDSLKVGDTLKDCHTLLIESGVLSEESLKKADEKAFDADAETSIFDESNITEFTNGLRAELKRVTLPSGHTVSMSNDITKLTEKNALFEEALELGQAGYWVYDFATKRYRMSQTLKKVLDTNTLGNIQQKGILSIIHPEDRESFRDALRHIGKTNDMLRQVYRSKPHNNKIRWNRITAQLLRDKNGKPKSIRAFVKDITREIHKEEELELAKDEAIAASHAKSEFLANMSHEIRTPMNGVLGMAELLSNTNIDDRQTEFVKIIMNSATALLDIINDILDFSKIEAGRLELDPTPVDLSESFNDVISLLVPKAQSKGLELILNYPSNLPQHFIVDGGRIKQILTNLVGNAIKFTEEGQVITTVNILEQTPGNAIVKVSVKDTGIGIESDKINKIFSKFTQADGSTTRIYGGTGLGLSISKKIVELMGGRIKVNSIFGEGSTFEFCVPLKVDKNARKPVYAIKNLKEKRVLIIDDIEINRHLISEQVKSWDMLSTVVDGGVEALVKLREAKQNKKPYDLVLVDYFMPGMDGKELCKIMNAMDVDNKTAVIMLSSSDEDMSSKTMKSLGIDAYLTKPAREMTLHNTIERVLSVPRLSKVEQDENDVIKVLETIKQDNCVTQHPSNTLEKPDAQAKSQTTKVEILVAEDFALNRDVVRLMLADTPFQPIFAENGQIAVDMFLQNPERFPIIIMDVSMPVMDGHDAARHIRNFIEETKGKDIPIIALTGHALKHDKEKCFDAGMDDYLTKPVQQTKLIQTLETYYAATQAGDYKKRVA